MDYKEKRKRFLEYAMQIKDLGYKVFTRNEPFTCYGWIINDKNEVGYFQLDSLNVGVRFSTVHKPSRCGTGFGLDGDSDSHTTMTREVVDRIFVHHPEWAEKDKAYIKKYKGDEFINNEKKKLWNDIIEL